MKEITISEFLNNEDINCPTVLIAENWNRLLNSDIRILNKINEWKQYKLGIKINSVHHADSFIRSPKDKGYINYFFDSNKKGYITYEIEIIRSLSSKERTQYGRCCNGLGCIFDLPLAMWITVLRADIQCKNNVAKIKCKCCGNLI